MPTLHDSADERAKQGLRAVALGDIRSAEESFRRGSESGSFECRYQLGRLHALLIAPDADPVRGFHWVLEAADSGHGEAIAQIVTWRLAKQYQGVLPHEKSAWLRRGIGAGSSRCLITIAVEELSVAMREPSGREWLSSPTLDQLKRLASRGNDLALGLVGFSLANLIPTQQDAEQAERIFSFLNEKGYRLPPDLYRPPMPPSGRPSPIGDCPRRLTSCDVAVSSTSSALSACERFYVALRTAKSLRPSITTAPEGGTIRSQIRTSDDYYIDPIEEDPVLVGIQVKLARSCGKDLLFGEQSVVLRYRPGTEYRLHADYLPEGFFLSLGEGGPGQRDSTAIAYLNDFYEGGETEFPRLSLKYRGVGGDILSFRNLDTLGRAIGRSVHRGCRVISGEKWIITLWSRQGKIRQEFG